MKFTHSVDSIVGLLRRAIISDQNICSLGYYRWVNTDQIYAAYRYGHTGEQIRHHYNKLGKSGIISTKMTTSGSRLYSLPAIDGYVLENDYFIHQNAKP